MFVLSIMTASFFDRSIIDRLVIITDRLIILIFNDNGANPVCFSMMALITYSYTNNNLYTETYNKTATIVIDRLVILSIANTIHNNIQ